MEDALEKVVILLKRSLELGGKEEVVRDCLKACEHLVKVCPGTTPAAVVALYPIMMELVAVSGVKKPLMSLCYQLSTMVKNTELGEIIAGVMLESRTDKMIQGRGLLGLNNLFLEKVLKLTPRVSLSIVEGSWHRPSRVDFIGRLACTPENRLILARTPGLVMLLALTQRSDLNGTRPVIIALLNISYQSKGGKALLVRGGCLGLVLRIMKDNPINAWTQAMCLKLVANLAVYPINRALLREVGFAPIIKGLQQLYPNSEEVQKAAVQALRNLNAPLKIQQ